MDGSKYLQANVEVSPGQVIVRIGGETRFVLPDLRIDFLRATDQAGIVPLLVGLRRRRHDSCPEKEKYNQQRVRDEPAVLLIKHDLRFERLEVRIDFFRRSAKVDEDVGDALTSETIRWC